MKESQRNLKDPFGFNEEQKIDPNIDKECAERIVRFVVLLQKTFNLTPKQFIYALELAYINIMRSKDLPLKKEEVDQIKKEALEYYNKNT